jgi:hypothetical protein
MFPMLRIKSLMKRICAAGLILLMQGPAMMVQEVAWAKMLVTYTREKGLARGVVETFDGNHPCAMCAKAADLRKREGGDPPGRPQEEKPFRISWGDMMMAESLALPRDSESELRSQAIPECGKPAGRCKDSPIPPPPERA